MHLLSAHALADLVQQGELSAVSVIQAAFQRIERCDPQIGAFLSLLRERALQRAEELDRKRARGMPLGKLAGVPVALKDNIHVQGERSTCGSRFLSHYRAPFDATVTRLLEEEDAIVIGKTNLDEFAMGSSTENSAYQLTRNPWDLSCSPGGSSGGSAAAVAARLCPLAFGSDTGGSIRQPAAFCGVTGFKPTYGRVSRYGLVAFASSLDQIGPLTTNVTDAALAMEVIGRHCTRDATSLPAPQETYREKLRAPLAGARIGVPWRFLEDLGEEARENFKRAMAQYEALGASIVGVSLDILSASVAVYYILATAEASTNLARFDGIRYGNRSQRAATLDEVYDFSKQEGFGAEVKNRILLGTYVLSSGYQDAYHRKAQKVRTLIIRRFAEAFQQCAVIALPASPFPAFPIGSIQDPLHMYLQDIYTIPANLAGLPAISVPSGCNSEGKPLGIQLIGPQLQDGVVLQYAYAYEQATPFHRAVPSLEGQP
jgi:aspartyl-tRNA(Asn)/glutamyl-tRNA(Gln) amidotransferase subunit A